MENTLKENIEIKIKGDKVFLFMKGTPEQPMCGFSAGVVQTLRQMGVSFGYFNIFDDEKIRQGIKEYASWPTIPQLYIDGEFVGGHDIIMQIAQSGELQKKLKLNGE